MKESGIGARTTAAAKRNGQRLDATKRNGSLWSVILAGGNGERMRPLIHRWLSRPTPKQYCAFVGTRSLLQHTVARASMLCPPDRQVIVIDQAHFLEARNQLRSWPNGTLMLQPTNRNTAAGVFLPLTHVRGQDPSGTVVIYPADHFVYPEEEFARVVASAVEAAERFPKHLILLGVVPEGPEVEYGWISPGPKIGDSQGRTIRTVASFVEKPPADKAAALLAGGGLWNTMVVAAKVETLWQLGWQHFPEMMCLFERFGDALDTLAEWRMLEDIYGEMQAHDFSSGILASAVSQVMVIELAGVIWSDWGNAERIRETLRRLGKEPAFPSELLQDPDPSLARVFHEASTRADLTELTASLGHNPLQSD